MERIFVNHIVPKERITQLKVSPAGNYFSYNLIRGQVFSRTYSLIPLNIQDKFQNSDFSDNIFPIQHRFKKLGKIGQVFRILFDNIELIKSIKNNTSVWFYNLTIHTFFAFMYLRFLKKNVKTQIIVLDYTPPKSFLNLNSFILKLINKANGVIVLSSNFNFTNKNQECIAGIVYDIEQKPEITDINYNFLMSGFVTVKKSIKTILDVFSELPEYTLNITGITDNELLIREYCEKFSNIHFHGLLSYKDYEKILTESTFCINSRDPNFEENRYNFPSKIIEHLAYNRIVLSTFKYEQLNGINYMIMNHQKNEMLNFFRSLKKMKKTELLKYANQSDIVSKKFSVSHWKNTMNKLEKNTK